MPESATARVPLPPDVEMERLDLPMRMGKGLLYLMWELQQIPQPLIEELNSIPPEELPEGIIRALSDDDMPDPALFIAVLCVVALGYGVEMGETEALKV